jgi:phage terminase large subunit
VTVDPRNAERKLPVLMPFLLFPKQREMIDEVLAAWRSSEGIAIVKARDVGASWVLMALSCTMCLFHSDFMAGVGSAKEDKVDRSGDPDTLFYKGRHFMQNVPAEFTGRWSVRDKRCTAHMRIVVPHTGSSITGEAGDNMGRGGRKGWYIVDEAAHIERPKVVDAALAATTNCRIDASSVNGMANSFGERVHSGRCRVFNFGWRDDPRKDDAWYAKKEAELDPVIVAQEIDCDFSASVEGQIIPSKWVNAAVDAHIRLGIPTVTGGRRNAFDVADEGKDKCAFVTMRGVLLEYAESWSGKGGDTLDSTMRVFRLVDAWGGDDFEYDADGLGATVKSDARVVSEARVKAKQRIIRVVPFRGSGAVMFPERVVPGADKRKNEDFFANAKAQNWWALRRRFAMTMRAIEGKPYNADEIISIAGPQHWKLLGQPDPFKERARLQVELSQPVWKWNTAGKMLVDKMPDGAMSPNLADGVMIANSLRNLGMRISTEHADAIERALNAAG